MRAANVNVKVIWRYVCAGSMAILVAACGGGSSTPSPSPTPGDAATITIANNAVSPRNITIARGSQVTFVNNDSRTHQMFSNPHPEHSDCPEINDVGFLNPGQSRQTGNMNTVRTCGYHDHELNTVVSLQGTITIQ
jgi:plastocyanin